MPTNRRKFLKVPLFAGFGFATRVSAQTALLTPAQGEGPFYPVVPQADIDFDLTKVDGKSGLAKGEVVLIKGRVLDTSGKAVSQATLDLWQANAFGRYSHPSDQSDKPLDENFQGWAIIQSGEDGGYQLKTILPGAYGVGQQWTRPPHIHFKISKVGYRALTTQMYFEGEALNDQDLLLQGINDQQRDAMIAKQSGLSANNEKIYRYDIVLERV